MTAPPLQDPKEPRKKDDKINDVVDYIKANAKETICYILLIIGIILIFFDPFIGETLVGLIAGSYFGEEIIEAYRTRKDFVASEGIARSLIFGGVVLAFIICAPGIFLGAIIAIGIKQLFHSK
jgi:hypothetical protein